MRITRKNASFPVTASRGFAFPRTPTGTAPIAVDRLGQNNIVVVAGPIAKLTLMGYSKANRLRRGAWQRNARASRRADAVETGGIIRPLRIAEIDRAPVRVLVCSGDQMGLAKSVQASTTTTSYWCW
jgi:hypothetical protein